MYTASPVNGPALTPLEIPDEKEPTARGLCVENKMVALQCLEMAEGIDGFIRGQKEEDKQKNPQPHEGNCLLEDMSIAAEVLIELRRRLGVIAQLLGI